MQVDGHEVLTDAAEACRLLAQDRVIGADLETTGFSPWRADIAVIQLYGDDTGTAAIIKAPEGRLPEPVLDLFRQDKLFIFHNGVGFDMPFLHCAGVDINKPRWYDTLVAEVAVMPMQRADYSKSLKASVKRRLGIALDKDIEHGHWTEELTQQQVEYAMRDVLELPALRRAQLQKAEEGDVLAGVEFEMGLTVPTAWMTINGLPLSREKLADYRAEQATIIAANADAYVAAFGALKPTQYQKLTARFIELGIDIPNTKKETLLDLTVLGGEAGRLADILLPTRFATKRSSMYDEDWAAKFVMHDGRVHSKFWQCSTDTTRYASSDPNLEQIPRDMRKVFGWVDGHLIVAVDYSQIEIRIAATLAHDEVLLADLESDDVHAAIAATIFGVPQDQVTFDQRKLAKGVSFTLLFGGGATKLYDYARRGGGALTEGQAYQVASAFFGRYKGIQAMRDRAQEMASTRRVATVRIPSGLKRVLVGSKLRSTTLINTAVQSTAAAGIKMGIMEAHRRGLIAGYVGDQVHDELVATVPEAEAAEYAEELKDAMLLGMNQACDCKPRADVKVDRCWLK
jgi:DNA polymerase-1